MSVLLLGAKVEDLEEITGVSMNANLRAIGVHRRPKGREGEEEVKIVGREDVERKVFEIDGRGGERIVKMEVGYCPLPYNLIVCHPLPTL